MSAGPFFRFCKGAEAEAVARWVSKRIPGCERGFGPCIALLVHDTAPRGAVLFHNYSPEAGVMEMSAAAESSRWLSRSVLRAIHGYIFDDAGCQMAVMRVSENNSRMRRIGRAYGYTETRIPRLRGRDEAEIIMTLTDDAWRVSRFHR